MMVLCTLPSRVITWCALGVCAPAVLLSGFDRCSTGSGTHDIAPDGRGATFDSGGQFQYFGVFK